MSILAERVGAGDEEKLVIGFRRGAEVAEGVDRVGRPGRSMSTRPTLNLGLDAVAITVIRYLSSGGSDRPVSFWYG